MSPELLTVHPTHPDGAVIAQAAKRLSRGELVVFPTETVYGLGADALDENAVARIFEAKGRPAWNPVILHVADTEAARALTTQWPEDAQRLADAFWPGPLTLVLPKHHDVPDIATAGLPAVAIRVPAHPVALDLLRAVGRPIAAPSANRFTQVSPTTAGHVMASLGDRVDCIIDGGPCDVGIESTVVDLCGDEPRLLRPGIITRGQIEAVLRRAVSVPTARVSTDAAAPQRSPGMAERHYAPRADVWLFDEHQGREIAAALATSRDDATRGPVIALLLRAVVPIDADDVVIRMPSDPVRYARALYAALHSADEHGARLVVIERPPDEDAWTAVRDRLSRAAH